jgi:hypothetical protein
MITDLGDKKTSDSPDIEIGPIDGNIKDPVQAGLADPWADNEISGSLFLQASVVFATWRLANMVVEINGRQELPNAFHRLTQRFILGITWELRNPALHETWLYKAKQAVKRVRRFFFPTSAEKIVDIQADIDRMKGNTT